jgi:hypothetical protein
MRDTDPRTSWSGATLRGASEVESMVSPRGFGAMGMCVAAYHKKRRPKAPRLVFVG